MMKCPNCGKSMPVGGVCPACGYSDKKGGGKGKKAPPFKKGDGNKAPPFQKKSG